MKGEIKYEMRTELDVHQLARMMKIRQITSWLSKILLFLGFAVISIFSAATLAHR